ncbi:phosphotransferase [Streptomyces sp. NPDC088554]|uniref:phosphotransferase n=1 Tax=Streptomyces sp. NPDC088554 TaxID=3365865 RepID=UPI00380672F1
MLKVISEAPGTEYEKERPTLCFLTGPGRSGRSSVAVVWCGHNAIPGPFHGHSGTTFVVPLPPVAGGPKWAKVLVRHGGPDFDRRYFRSDKELLSFLQGRIARIPRIVEPPGCDILQSYVPGDTLDFRLGPGRSPSDGQIVQLGDFFRELISVEPKEIETAGIRRVCTASRLPRNDDSADFLDRLVWFTEHQVFRGIGRNYASLFAELGIRAKVFDVLRGLTGRLSRRPPALLHGDLHKKNVIVDRHGKIWVIDWELAMIGDPLYDAVTLVHLMRLAPPECHRFMRVWRCAAEHARPWSSHGWEKDLPVLLAYKRVQSVFTDVIRTANFLGGRTELVRSQLSRAAEEIHRVLRVARGPLRLAGIAVPSVEAVAAAYRNWFLDRQLGARLLGVA